MASIRRSTIRKILREAAAKSLKDGWLFLDTQNPTLESECVFVSSSNDAAKAAGFSVAGLDTQSLEDVVDWTLQFLPDPSDSLLLESFIYYWRFDAWLPEPGAADPLPPEEAKKTQDREFFELLTPRSSFVQCKKPGCHQGAVEHSLLCNVHHYEMIKHEPCPFSRDA